MTAPAVLADLFPGVDFLARIGAGAYGEIWLARFPGEVCRAVKLVAADPARPDSAAREHHAWRLLRSLAAPADPLVPIHPALVPLLDLRETPDAFGVVMPLADSLRPNWVASPADYAPRTLSAELLARRALPLPECLELAERLASALDFLQRHCLVHRDIKPSNVLYLDGKPVLADPGLLADTREASSVVGTPGYVPGEQHGRFPADLFSLGVLLSEAATGRSATELGYAPVEEADTGHPLYARFLALLRRVTDPNPARRPQTAAAFLKELRALSAAPPRRHRILSWLLLALAAAFLAVIFLLSHRPLAPAPAGGEDEPPADVSPEAEPAPLPARDSTETTETETTETGGTGGAEAHPGTSVDSVDSVVSVDSVARPSLPPPAPLPATNRPLLYISSDMADAGAFLQLYTDRIRVGLPLRGFTTDDAALLLVLPPDDPAFATSDNWTGPAPWQLVPLVPVNADNTPPTAKQDPVFPTDAPYPGRSTHAAIAFLPGDAPYPEAIFFLPNPPYVWEARLANLPHATFEDLEHLWWKACELPRIDRESGEMLREVESNPRLRGDFL
ncbi:MAG: protein kinase [Kiritimatiellae bacterium]|nr:protein kinase [Kiritimatiellia bacterium]